MVGTVMYDSQIDVAGNPYSSDRPRGPEWLKMCLERISSAKRRDCSSWTMGAEKGLARMLVWSTSLSCAISIWSTSAAPESPTQHFVRIKELTELTTLELIDTTVTDAGLEHIKGLRQLISLFLFGHQYHRCWGMTQVKELTGLRDLRLGPHQGDRRRPKAHRTIIGTRIAGFARN